MSNQTIRLALVGDVFTNRDDPDSMLREVSEVFADADYVWGNCEGVYSDISHRPPTAAHQLVAPRAYASALGRAGFTAMGLANNHTLDGGYIGLENTLEALHEEGIVTAGAGENLKAARQPAISTVSGVRVGALAYTPVFLAGNEARERIPGVAPLRVDTAYVTNPNVWIPGKRPRIVTKPWPSDMEAMVADVSQLAANVDVVIVSFHWGDSVVPLELAGYERELARAAVDAGAHVVVGGHQHSLRGAELHDTGGILYGLGNFAFDLADHDGSFAASTASLKQQYGEYALGPRAGYPTFPFHPDYRNTVVAVVELEGTSVSRIGLIPCLIQPAGHPAPLHLDAPAAQGVIEYMHRAMSTIGSDATLVPSESLGLGGFAALELVRAS